MNIFNSFLHMKRVGDVQVQTNKILDDPDLSDDQKMKQLLAIDFIKVTVNNASRSIGNKLGQGNYKVVDFLCQKENLERLVKYSVAVPDDPDDKDESYKYPLVAQELICHSGVIAEALIEGGWANQAVQNEDEDDEDNDTEGEDDDDTEGLDDEESKEENKQSQEEDSSTTKKFTQVQLKMSQKSKNVGGSKLMNKARLQIQLDDDEENKEEVKDETNKGSVNQEPDPEGQNAQTITRDPEQEPETQSTETTAEVVTPVEENQQNTTLSPETVKELNKKVPAKDDALDTEEIVLQEVEENKEESKEETKEEQKDQTNSLVEAKKVTFQPTKQQNEEEDVPAGQISQKFLDLGKKTGQTNQEEDDDFERDEEDKDAFEAEERDENPIQNQLQELENDDDERDEDANINDDDQDGTNNVTISMKTRNNNSVISKVNINVTNLNATANKKGSKKKNKKKKQNDSQQEPPPLEDEVKFPLLDILFSFLGIQSEENKDDVKAVQEQKLNLFKSRSMASRSSAGTIDQMPGSMNDILRNTQSFKKREDQNTQVEGDLPDLLPVSCGYFFNIVRQLLLKQRKFMLKYVLIDTKGALFDKLVNYIQYHSLSDLLIEIMQINVFIRDWRESEDDQEDSSEPKKDKVEDDKQPKQSSEQEQMAQVLKDKKVSVIKKLIATLSHKNRENIEASLNASSVLIELVELEKTFEIFMDNDAELIGQIMQLAVDPSNSFNQKYLLQILIVICKQLKPSAQSQNVFKDIEEENEGNNTNNSAAGIAVSSFFSNFEKDAQLTQNLLKFMGQVQNNDLIANLLLVINLQDLGNSKDSYYENQYNTRIKKIGLSRLRSLELCHSILSLLFPSFGPFAEAQLKLNGIQAPKCPHDDFDLTKYVTTSLRRQIVRTTLLVLVTYQYCCIGNQFCIMILDQIKTLFDVIDVVQLQKFVISEFRDRHQLQYDMHKYNRQRGSDEQIKRYWINHMNMQSAQVNQMTIQLKDKVLQIQEFYKTHDQLSDAEIKGMIGSDVKYTDLISNPDLSFWQYLCKKDFRRLDKLLTQNLGEGHFLDDSDENESSEDAKSEDDVPTRDVDDLDPESDYMDSESSGLSKKRRNIKGKDDIGDVIDDENNEDGDHKRFMDDMLQNFQKSSLSQQIESEEEIASRKEEEEKAQYSDNQFWSSGLQNQMSQMDLDKMIEDMD